MWLLGRKLERGRFAWPGAAPDADPAVPRRMTLWHSDLFALLSGIDPAGTKRCNWRRRERALAVSAAVHWLHVGSQGAAPAVAAIMSLMESCRRMGIDARTYLEVFLPQPASTHLEEVAEFSGTREQRPSLARGR